MNENNFAEGLALGRGMKGEWTDSWLMLVMLAIFLGGNDKSEAEVTRKEFDELKAAVEAMRGGVSHDE